MSAWIYAKLSTRIYTEMTTGKNIQMSTGIYDEVTTWENAEISTARMYAEMVASTNGAKGTCRKH